MTLYILTTRHPVTNTAFYSYPERRRKNKNHRGEPKTIYIYSQTSKEAPDTFHWLGLSDHLTSVSNNSLYFDKHEM